MKIDGRVVYVHGQPVTISLTEEVRKHGCYGWFFAGRLEILLEPGMVDAYQKQTLWHELAHAAVGLMMDHESVDARQIEEFYVRAISGGLLEILSDPRNKWLRGYLFG